MVTICHEKNLAGQFICLDVWFADFAGVGGTGRNSSCGCNCAIDHALLEMRYSEGCYLSVNTTLGFLVHTFSFGMSRIGLAPILFGKTRSRGGAVAAVESRALTLDLRILMSLYFCIIR